MYIEIDHIRLAYDERGAGIPLLFLHGYPLNRHIWAPQLEGLADIARVFTLDMRGHGESSAVAGPYLMDVLADDCNRFLDQLGIIQPIVLCGLSMGGYVSMAFCRRYPQRLAGLILTATRHTADSPEVKANRDKTSEQAKTQGVKSIVDTMLPKLLSPKTYTQNPALVEQVRQIMESTSLEGVLGDLAGLKDRPDSTETLAGLKIPALIIHGKDDQIVPLEATRSMHALLPHARLEILPDAGHLPNLEQPALFNQAVRHFLSSLK